MAPCYTPQTPALKPYVHHISMTEFEASHADYTAVIPDSMTELVIMLDGSYHRMVQGAETLVNRSHFIGIKSKPGFVKSNPLLKTISIRFKPGAIGFFTAVPGIEVRDDIVDPVCLFGPSFKSLENKLGDCPDEQAILPLVESFLCEKFSPGEKVKKTHHRILNMYRNPEGARLDKLSGGLESYKSLEREFNANLGISPKNFLRILQFNYATYCLSKQYKNSSLTEIAYQCGYFDQAHFIKSFKSFSSATPGDFIRLGDDMALRNQEVINSCFSHPFNG